VRVGHLVRVYGNVEAHRLAHGVPGGGTINAGQVIDCGIVTQGFEVAGDHEVLRLVVPAGKHRRRAR
jgi:hypothetical protein